ncbi:MAG: phosphatase PAP2 family protein [Ferruginibacter sp.]
MRYIPDYTGRTAKKLLANFGILLAVFIICLAVFLWLADMTFHTSDLQFDDKVFKAIHPYYNDGLTHFFQVITWFGSQEFLLPAYLVLIIIFLSVKKIRFYGWKIAIISITGVSVMFGLKALLERQRPLVPLISKAHGYSFPSGHSFSSFLFFGMIAYIVYKTVDNLFWRWTIILLLAALVLLIGYSRIYLKVHYATDVMAGFLLAAIWLMLAKWILIDRRRSLPPGNQTLIK